MLDAASKIKKLKKTTRKKQKQEDLISLFIMFSDIDSQRWKTAMKLHSHFLVDLKRQFKKNDTQSSIIQNQHIDKTHYQHFFFSINLLVFFFFFQNSYIIKFHTEIYRKIELRNFVS